jgi:hypothetical protein
MNDQLGEIERAAVMSSGVFEICLLLASLLGMGITEQMSGGELSQSELTAIARTAVMHAVCPRIASDKPRDYFPALCSPVIINDLKTRSGIAVGFSEAPKEFEIVRQTVTTGLVWKGALGDTFPYVNTGSHWRDKWITTYTVQSVGGGDASGASDLRLMFHEAAHTYAFQRLHQISNAAPRARLAFSYPLYDATNSALAILESEILAKAYAPNATARDLLRLAGQFVSIRAERFARLGSDFPAFEIDNEMNEGLAEYLGKDALRRWRLKHVVLSADLERAAKLGNLSDAERKTNEESAGFLLDRNKVRLGLTRERAYHSGPAIGYLLDAVAPGWIRTIERDPTATSWSILLARTGLAARNLERLAASTKNTYGYDALFQDEVRVQRDRKAANDLSRRSNMGTGR